MKFFHNNISQLLQKIPASEINSLLLYGPDDGMISELCSKLSSTLSMKISKHEYTSSAALFSVLNNYSFFSTKELIKIEVKSTELDKEAIEIAGKQNVHFPIFIVKDLKSSGRTRKFFEEDKGLAVIACYQDDEKSVKQIISSKVIINNKHIEADAIEFLAHKLHGDRMLINNELEKLFCFIGGETRITIDHCRSIISDSVESEPDLLCIYFASKKPKGYLFELNNLLENSISVIWVIRALARYYINILTVKLYEADGIYIDDAMKKLKPPIFFKYVASFRDIANNTSIKEVSKILTLLAEAEIEAKTGTDHGIIMDNLFMKHFTV